MALCFLKCFILVAFGSWPPTVCILLSQAPGESCWHDRGTAEGGHQGLGAHWRQDGDGLSHLLCLQAVPQEHPAAGADHQKARGAEPARCSVRAEQDCAALQWKPVQGLLLRVGDSPYITCKSVPLKGPWVSMSCWCPPGHVLVGHLDTLGDTEAFPQLEVPGQAISSWWAENTERCFHW